LSRNPIGTSDDCSPLQRDSAALGFLAATRLSDSTRGYARYDGEIGNGAANHAFTAGIRLIW
jgi:hypothetical protein